MTTLPRLDAYCERIGLELEPLARRQLDAYRSLLLEANQRFNLTRITDPDEFEQRALIESVALVNLIPDTAESLLDIGSGGGIPGLPIAIVRPDLNVVLLDATAKKVSFLNAAIAELGLTNARALQGRAEELGREPEHRDHYDVVTARAVARLATLAELALPMVNVGGIAIFPKGDNVTDEYAEAQYAIRMLRGRGRAVLTRMIAGTAVIRIDKRAATPAQFPRRTGVPNRSPLSGPNERGVPA